MNSYPIPRTCPLDPPSEYRDPRSGRPIRRVRLDFDGSEVWLVTRYEDARAVLGDARFSSDFATPGFPARLTSQPPGPGTFIRMDPPDHSRLRRLLLPEFNRRRVEALRPAIRRIAGALVDELAAQGPPADLVEALALPLPSQVITELLGVPYEDRDYFHETTKVIGDRNVEPEQRMKVREDLRHYLERLVAEREQRPVDDLLSRLGAHREAARVSREEVVGIATLLMVAGYETIANQIGVGTVALLENPDRLTELRERPEALPAAVEEIIRHQTVIDYGARRAATADVEVGGQTIKQGEGVVVVLAAANRDEEAWAEPDRLDFSRFGDLTDRQEHLSFGFGIHQCMGQLLARAQLEIAWSTLFDRLPGLRLAVPLDEVPFRSDMFVYGVHALPVTWG
ncbi:cytochrome P450 [Nonomuraea cavernae]|uniref:Cytochrome P450 n=1 Tax=Nonomuraea cavernae TaxID=2045107 RepID=A0A917Z9V2_9ACTN|nr:cytochrome P450 [Nonomuraea cavernae]MCA2185621.1 cytochrome P450 [Nonomuraea cavernae]GGO78078.1 cytochrome P450 [Nonomuraea cavernae]